jgi:hypothetical protein
MSMQKRIPKAIWHDVRVNWGYKFTRIRKAIRGKDIWPDIRTCAAVWMISGVLYEKYHTAKLEDTEYDILARYLLEHYNEVQNLQSIGVITIEDLQAGTAMGYEQYGQQYQDIAEVLAEKST